MGKQNFVTFQLLAISGILLSILVSMVAFRHFTLPSSKATSTEVVVSPPYIKLEKVGETFENGQKIIEVATYANTNGMKVNGVDIVFDYDTKILEFIEPSFQSSGALSVSQLNPSDLGVVNFSLFSSTIRNEPVILTNANQEVELARLKFKVLDTTVNITQLQLEFVPDQQNETNMMLEQDPRPEVPTDILHAVQSAIISL